MSRPIQRVLIVGRDAALWLTALGLRRALGGLGVTIEVVELPSLLRPADAYASTPSLASLHHMLGLDEGRVLAHASGSEAWAQRFSGWSKGDHAFMHAYDSVGVAINQIDFINYWTKARADGLRAAFDEFSLGAAAAKVGRHVIYNDAVESFSQAAAGYNLDARRYIALLREAAIKAGARPVGEPFRSVEMGRQGIAAVVLGSGRKVEADLYIDATGLQGALISRMGGDIFAGWGHWFPCDRLMAASGPRLRPLPAFNQVTAFEGGWVAQYPLQDRTAVVGAYNSQVVPEGEVMTVLSRITGMRLEAGVASPYQPGARPRPWIDNCVAIGEAAVSLEPLDATTLQFIHVGLSHLITQFPVDADDLRERDAFNETFDQHVAAIRDFTLLHYKLNRRFDQPMWDWAREAHPSEVLAQKIELFSARGGLAMRDGETFGEGSWTSCFVGHGLIPKSWNPLVDQLSQAEQIEHFQQILGFVAAHAQDMPSLEAHLEFNAAPPGRGLF
jgi:tryptophan 7-halogenase